MGITCKPMGKMKSIMRKLDNELAREKAEKTAKSRKKNDN